jgi:hypothetical protein
MDDSELHDQLDQRLLHLLKLIQSEEQREKLASYVQAFFNWSGDQNWLDPTPWQRQSKRPPVPLV